MVVCRSDFLNCISLSLKISLSKFVLKSRNLIALIAPRPFMVERGHNDGVGIDEWVAYEFAKVRRHYDYLGLQESCRIEYFNGPHMIHGVGTFEFLDRHLKWNVVKVDTY